MKSLPKDLGGLERGPFESPGGDSCSPIALLHRHVGGAVRTCHHSFTRRTEWSVASRSALRGSSGVEGPLAVTRVERRRGAVGSGSSGCRPLSRLRRCLIPSHGPFPAPAQHTGHGDFRHPALPAESVSGPMRVASWARCADGPGSRGTVPTSRRCLPRSTWSRCDRRVAWGVAGSQNDGLSA